MEYTNSVLSICGEKGIREGLEDVKQTKKRHCRRIEVAEKNKKVSYLFLRSSPVILFLLCVFRAYGTKRLFAMRPAGNTFLKETHHKSRLINRHHTRPQSKDKDAAFSADLLGAFYS